VRLSTSLPPLLCAALCIVPSTVRAQTRQAIVRVFVVDSSGSAVTGAELAILRGLNGVIAH